ncbi:molybdenum cofactor cytidylyltransferase [Clostridium pasteurianum DSM 525 = ATCC 6013]|uniref:MobA-like NTP transferase domain containing protein n=1 Tax=Clostridium pasteurianum DSM 525 = ATCC 6013 TaxID=1262449 RepID=A0A0H3IY53_CLOPA|nr:nucleotidyltransferase family protein [Clostridium pasteurianum]AJA46431.1 molybdenum cofactor cytidylyltransferase [Clostridium pasteurianum DSM 525 = ATCC 6013]AJA50419.1 molybdenum cofactor cytidylyltransferase [Clostridium pasteurianum DSM 525 = ATCC 6013]AOZ73866.1 molybdopterin-guanine dinucleotide biosynthesis protein A [Clostridium pasteurianum DSM 525 = ATCC 6013]AOZ77663.1 molybdopterin-guanine dinucleotide biosynthesis protein A [Clostridium pasteurianum]ELP61006.1 molybdopterin-
MKIEGIILAAGFSSRARTFKMALDFKGKTVIERSVDSMKSCCSKIYVISGYRREIIEEILKGYEDVDVVFNENFKEGMFSSVKAGIKKLRGDKFFLTPGDYPAVKEDTYKALLTLSKDVVIPTFKGKKGHPILMNTPVAREILSSDNYSNLKEFTISKGFSTVEVQDMGILRDIDTIQDYEDLLNLKY